MISLSCWICLQIFPCSFFPPCLSLLSYWTTMDYNTLCHNWFKYLSLPSHNQKILPSPLPPSKNLGPWVAQMVKNLTPMWETKVWSLGQEDPLEEEMATHSSILAWKIPWTEEPGWLQSMYSQRIRYDWANNKREKYLGYSRQSIKRSISQFVIK